MRGAGLRVAGTTHPAEEPMKTKTALATLGIGAALLLTGCTPGGPSPSHSPKAAVVNTTAPALPGGVSQATNVPTDVANDPAIRKSVTLTSCAVSDGGWTAKGTATNNGTKSKKYTITVFFTTATATVLHTDATTVTAKPGDTTDWTIVGAFKAPDGTRCVLRGVA